MEVIKLLFLLSLTCSITNGGSLLTKGSKKHKAAKNSSEKVKKQQVLVPLRNFATSTYGQNNIMSPMFHLDGVNEDSPYKAPSTVFVNGDNQAGEPYSPMEEHQTEDNEQPYQGAAIDDNTYNTAYTSLFGNEMENYNHDDNSDNTNVAFADDNGQVPYDEQPNEEYTNQANEEDEENAPVRTVMNPNNNYITDAAMQGGLAPTLSSLIASRIRAINRLNSLGQKHPTFNQQPNYSSLVKQLLKTEAGRVKASVKIHSDDTASEAADKKDNRNQNHNLTQDINTSDETKMEDAEKELEYKKNVKNAELAANLAEAAKTLTKLVNKLQTAQDTTISLKQGKEHTAKKNNTEEISVDGGWSEWSKWSRCTTSCGGGLSYSKRSCTNPVPLNDGKNCTGRGIKVRLCHLNRCKTTGSSKVNLERSLSEMAAERSHIYKP